MPGAMPSELTMSDNVYSQLLDSADNTFTNFYRGIQMMLLTIVLLLGLVVFLGYRLYSQRPETQYGPQGEMWISMNGCFIPYQADQKSGATWCETQSGP